MMSLICKNANLSVNVLIQHTAEILGMSSYIVTY